MVKLRRRAFLATVGAIAVAGCSGPDDPEPTDGYGTGGYGAGGYGQ